MDVSLGHRQYICQLYAPLPGEDIGLCKPKGHIRIFLLPVPRFLEKSGYQSEKEGSDAQMVDITPRSKG